MDSAAVLNEIMLQTILSMNTCYPATVLSFDIAKQEATIQPIFQTKERGQPPKTQSIVQGVPVLKHRYQERPQGGAWGNVIETQMVLRRGDIVMCTVAQRSMDKVLSGTPHYAGKARIMNNQDSVIVGVIKYA